VSDHAHPARRREDRRLLTSGGTFVADIRDGPLAGAYAMHIVRSPVASATIRSIDIEGARAMPGVVAVFTADDLDIGPMPPVLPRFAPVLSPPILAAGVVRHVGEAVAAVLARTEAQAVDAAELIVVDLVPMDAVADVGRASVDDRLVITGAGTNVVGSLTAGHDDPRTLFDDCELVVRLDASHPRISACPLEVRSAASVWIDGRLHHWVSTQGPHSVRRTMAAVFALPEDAVRVIAPDVGGGFGPKFANHTDDVLVAWAARRVGHSVRWTETRSESMVGLHHGRAQLHHIALGGDAHGTLRAYQLTVTQDSGAYASLGAYSPDATLRMTTGVYAIERARASARALLTNTTPVSAYRGTGRPEATCAIERAVDRYAAVAGIDPVALRLRNMVPGDAFPYTSAVGTVYDSGAYADALRRACEIAGYDARRTEQAAMRQADRATLLGIGVCAYVESTGAGPPMEFATLTVGCDGAVVVRTGSSPHGQGHETTWATLVERALGVPAALVSVLHGDTDQVAAGLGTFASRSTQFAGSAIVQAAESLVAKARALAAHALEAAEADVVFDAARGSFSVRGAPARSLTWRAVLDAAGLDELGDSTMFTGSMTFPFGAHVAIVEVDRDTGGVRVLRHVAVDDAGTIVNPTIAEGQIHGGIAQGIAEALYEEVRYDEGGTPLTTNLADYAVPAASELPSFETAFTETPAPSNPLGAKGVGESGIIGAVAAVQNAVCDAVAHLGVEHIDLPLTPVRVWRALREAERRVSTVEQ
jgi:carbon-monoxide dehydrogenase large subunit